MDACTSGRPIAPANSLFRRSRISRGMRAGPNSAAHEVIENSGMPASAIVGTSGSSGLRLESVVANARSLPSFTCASPVVGVASIICTRPATRSVMPAGSPLYGTWTISMPASELICANDTIEGGPDAVQQILDLTDGLGADYTFEATGNVQVMRQAVESAR